MTLNPSLVQMAGVTCGILCVLFAWMRWRDRDPGADWFALGFLLIFLIIFLDMRAVASDRMAHRGAGLFGGLAVVCIGLGLVDYIGAALRRPTRWRIALALPVAVALAWLLVAPLPRPLAHGLVALSLVVMSAMAWRASRLEPGIGMRLIAVSLLLHPLCLVVLLTYGVDVYQLRYLLVLPISALALTLFAVSLTRARQRLQELNDSLEHRVTQRTRELHDMVVGLQSFSRSVSHDLRGPLGGMSALTRMAIDTLQDGDQERAVRMLETVALQSDQLATLVEDLLTLARVSDTPLSRRPVDLRVSVDEATEQLRLAGQSTEAVNVAALGRVDADPGLLRQVFVNLIGNALKFSRQAPRPAVHVEMLDQPGRVVVAVRDNGAGFDPARAAELFEPFRRLHGGAFEGSGVGLTIVRRIVERHGGAVWADGRPGAGATFYVELPARS